MRWWLNFYFADGPGISKDTPRPTGWKRVAQTFAREWWALIQLNVLFITTCLPLITLPAACVAMLCVTAKMVEDEPYDLWREYRLAFAQNFWLASSLGVSFAMLLALLISVLRFYADAATEMIWFALPLSLAAATLVFLAMASVVLMGHLATVRAPLWELLGSAAITVVVQPLPLLAALGVNALVWLIHIAGYPGTILFAVTINFSFGALLLSFASHDAGQRCLAYVRGRQGAHLEPHFDLSE